MPSADIATYAHVLLLHVYTCMCGYIHGFDTWTDGYAYVDHGGHGAMRKGAAKKELQVLVDMQAILEDIPTVRGTGVKVHGVWAKRWFHSKRLLGTQEGNIDLKIAPTCFVCVCVCASLSLVP